jgi:hypothetical protein
MPAKKVTAAKHSLRETAEARHTVSTFKSAVTVIISAKKRTAPSALARFAAI